MSYYELKNTATNERAQVIASNMREAATKAGWACKAYQVHLQGACRIEQLKFGSESSI